MGKACAIIVAAGKGSRMGAGKNKQFIDIKGKPLLCYTLEAFSNCPVVEEIVIVCAGDEIQYCRDEIVGKYGFEKVKSVVAGGAERQDSVFSGLSAVKGCAVVLIHDGARPFVTGRILEEGIRYAEEYGASACGVTPKDTIKVRDESGFSERTLDRSRLFSVQTPQCFKFDLIMGCYEKLLYDETLFTDDTSVAEHFGHKVFLYEGSYDNIKITTPEDLAVAESILARRKV